MGFLASAPPHRAEAEPRALAWPPSDCRVAPPNLQVAQHKFVDDNSPKLVRDLPAWTDGKFRRKLVKWTCLCECFPYRMSLLVLIVNDFEQKGQVNQAAGCARTRLGADDKVDRCEAALRDARACVDALIDLLSLLSHCSLRGMHPNRTCVNILLRIWCPFAL